MRNLISLENKQLSFSRKKMCFYWNIRRNNLRILVGRLKLLIRFVLCFFYYDFGPVSIILKCYFSIQVNNFVFLLLLFAHPVLLLFQLCVIFIQLYRRTIKGKINKRREIMEYWPTMMHAQHYVVHHIFW